MIDKKFCSACQNFKEAVGGYKKPNSCRGWICDPCYKRHTPSIYSAQKVKNSTLGSVK